jgi:oligopeptide transport system substrate-binding protein
VPADQLGCVAIAAMWKKLGVNVEHSITERKVHYANMRRGDFEVGDYGWNSDYNDAQNFL